MKSGSVLATPNPKQGLCAYADHALVIGKEDPRSRPLSSLAEG